MALSFEAGEVKRGDVFFVNPEEVIVREEHRGRHIAPSEDKIVAMAISLSQYGQRQACETRRVEGKRLQLVLGFTRMAGARLLRKGFEHKGVFYHDPEFALKVQVVDANDETAFVRNVVENCHRNATSPVDDAYNQERLRDRYGWNDGQIADLYQCPVSAVQRLRCVLSLSREEQVLVHEGKMSVNAVVELLDAPAEKRQEILQAATGENGKVNGAKVRSEVREVVREVINDTPERERELILSASAPKNGSANGKVKPLSMAEVRGYFTDLLASDDRNLSSLGAQVLEFLSGRQPASVLTENLATLVSETVEEEAVAA